MARADPVQVLAAAMTMAFVPLQWFFLAWAYSRALVGTMARVMQIWRPRPPRREGRDVFESWWL